MEAINQVMQQNMTNFPSREGGITCEVCGTFVPEKEFEFMGRKSVVQPVCRCVTKKIEEDTARRERFVQEKTTRRLFSISELGEKFKESTFDNFIVRPGSEVAHKACLKYVNEFKEWGGDSLGLWGTYGNGKSLLAAAVANELSSKGHTVVFQTTKQLLDKLKSSFGDKSNFKYDEIIRALVTCDLLVLDDIGAEKVTEWTEETFFGIIDHRYRKKRPIFYTTNLKPSELHEKIGGRSVDRLSEMCVQIENKASSYRKEIAKERMKALAKELEA